MITKNNLADLTPGDCARVTSLLHSPEMNRRLQDLGLIEGTCVECLYRSPWGSPAAYLIRGAVVAIRSCDAHQVRVTPQLSEEVCGCD